MCTGSDFAKYCCASPARLHAYIRHVDNTYFRLAYQGPVGSHACTQVSHFVPLLLRFPCPLSFRGFTYGHAIKQSASPPPCRALFCLLIYYIPRDSIDSCHPPAIPTSKHGNTCSTVSPAKYKPYLLIVSLARKICHPPSSDEGVVFLGQPVNP